MGCLGYTLLLILLLIPCGFVAAFIIAISVGHSSPTFFSEVLMVGILVVVGIPFLVGFDWVRRKIAVRKARRYLRNLPEVDAQNFYNAFPGYERNFLFKFRQTLAKSFDIDEAKVSPDFDLSITSPLSQFVTVVYVDLFETFCPPALKETEIEYSFPGGTTLSELLKKTHELSQGNLQAFANDEERDTD